MKLVDLLRRYASEAEEDAVLAGESLHPSEEHRTTQDHHEVDNGEEHDEKHRSKEQVSDNTKKSGMRVTKGGRKSKGH